MWKVRVGGQSAVSERTLFMQTQNGWHRYRFHLCQFTPHKPRMGDIKTTANGLINQSNKNPTISNNLGLDPLFCGLAW